MEKRKSWGEVTFEVTVVTDFHASRREIQNIFFCLLSSQSQGEQSIQKVIFFPDSSPKELRPSMRIYTTNLYWVCFRFYFKPVCYASTG